MGIMSQVRNAFYPVFNCLFPKGSPKSGHFKLNFANASNGSFVFSAAEDELAGKIEFIQGAFVDNSANPAPLSIFVSTTEQPVVLPPYSQGYIPLFLPFESQLTFTTSGTPICNVDLVNFPVPAEVWSVNGNIAGGSTGLNFSANQPAFPPAGTTLIATVPANGTRAHLEVQNQSADEIIAVRDDGAGNNLSYIYMDPGAGAGFQGGAWTSDTFKGRLRVYSANPASQVSVFTD